MKRYNTCKKQRIELPKTRKMQTTRYRSMALRRDEIGASSLEMKLIVDYIRKIPPDTVEYVYKNQEESYKKSHSAGHHFWLDQETDPADNDKHETRKINLNGNYLQKV